METDVIVIALPEKKRAMEDTFRKLWRECFNDPAAYEDFYFQWVYRGNTVYAFEEKGMLHLNPYSCVVGEEERLLHYIVGVGTKHSERRKGIMRKLLMQALRDMYQVAEPFTYLMPADVRYYEPFGFVSISEKREHALHGEQMLQTEHNIIYQNYSELSAQMDEEARQQFDAKIDSVLSEQYTVYARHDADYFELLCQEKCCQGGDVVFCFQGTASADNLLGFFAYSVDGSEYFIEQSVFDEEFSRERTDAILNGYAYLSGRSTVIERFPFMVRITNVSECMKLFPEALYSYAVEGNKIRIIDEEIPDNSGIFSINYIDGEITVEQQRTIQAEQAGDLEEEIKELSISELTKIVFAVIPSEQVYFAEIV